MKHHLVMIVFLLPVLIGACGLNPDHEEAMIINNYYVGWSDMEANRCVYFKEDPRSHNRQIIIDGYVYAVGNDLRYIIAKSHNGFGGELTLFHILDTHGKYHTNTDHNNYWLFHSTEAFEEKRKELGISAIKYDRIYPEGSKKN